MAEGDPNLRLKQNAFTDLGFEAVDDVVAMTLKRGSGRGEPPNMDLVLSSGYTAEIPREDINSIRATVDLSTSETVSPATDLILNSLNQVIKKAREDEQDQEAF